MFLKMGRGQGMQRKGFNRWGKVREYKEKVQKGRERSGSTTDRLLQVGKGQRVQM